jgi:hypothetical protein
MNFTFPTLAQVKGKSIPSPDSQPVIPKPKFEVLSNGEHKLSISAVPLAEISVFDGKFQLSDHKIEEHNSAAPSQSQSTTIQHKILT